MNHQHLPMNHDPILVGLSFAVAIFAAYAALATVNRLRQGNPTPGWLWLGAITFGLGVWAMHFTAMTALQMGVLVAYDPLITAASVVFSILGAALAFNLVSVSRVAPWRILVSGTSLGAGIGVMHYVGMFAIRTEARMEFDLLLVGASVLVAATLGTLGMWLLTTNLLGSLPGRGLLTAAVTGSAIPFMHYMAMTATRFTADAEAVTSAGMYGGLLSINAFLILAVVVVGLPMFLTSLVGSTEQPGTVEVES